MQFDSFKKMLVWLESDIERDEREFLLRGSVPIKLGDVINGLGSEIMNDLKQPDINSQPDVTCLPEFWRELVLSRSAFPEVGDYHASIRVLFQLQEILAKLLAPYLRASMISIKHPGAMCSLEHELFHARQEHKATTENASPAESTVPPGHSAKLAAEFQQELVQLRNWEGTDAMLRCVLLLGQLSRMAGPARTQAWFHERHSLMDGDTPHELVQQGDWSKLAERLEIILAGQRI